MLFGKIMAIHCEIHSKRLTTTDVGGKSMKIKKHGAQHKDHDALGSF